MSQRRRTSATGASEAPAERSNGQFTPVEGDEFDFMQQEAEYRKQFEPLAPWNRKDIPDYGPLDDRHYLLIFSVVGILATIFYETTSCVPPCDGDCLLDGTRLTLVSLSF